ncbi:MAG: fibronectin type III domain-containing protein, partial [Bacteroidota bacterium]
MKKSFACIVLFLIALHTNAQEVVSYTLVNATTDQDIGPLNDGDYVNLALLNTTELSIRANTNPEVVGSVTMSLNQGQIFSLENFFPYTLVGDTEGDYRPWSPALGTYTLISKAYPLSKAQGTASPAYRITFQVINQPPPATPSNLNATAANAQEIQVTWNDNSNNEESFLLEADLNGGTNFQLLAELPANTTNFSHPNLTAGQTVSYRVRAKIGPVYSEYSNQAQATTPDDTPTIRIQQFVLVNAITNQDIMVLKDGDVINYSDIGTTSISIRADTEPNKIGSVAFY